MMTADVGTAGPSPLGFDVAAHRPRFETDLPVPLSRLVGREREAAAIGALVRARRRLVTIVGPGGVGKTRLALRAGADLAPDFRDGAAFVDLSAITDPDLVMPAVARALRIVETWDDAPEGLLRRAVGDAALLLILDNLEQVEHAFPRIATLMDACPALCVIATSRVPLRIAGEQEFPLAPLPLPDDTWLTTPMGMSASPAMALFVERARAFRPDFAVTATNAPAVVEICRRLDGLPLALELAAAWCRVMSPEALLLRLSNRLDLLRGGSRNLPERQKTMRATIEWSHELLTSEEQAVLRAFAVFSGGWTLEAAEAVLPSPDDALELTVALVERSLVHPVGAEADEPRFGMLETVREYGLERLESAGEVPRTRAAHAAHFLALAERLGRNPAEAALDRLARDHANLRSAIAWLHAEGDPEEEIRLLAAVARLWYAHSYLREGRAWLESGLERAGEQPSVARALALRWLGVLSHYGGDDARSRSALEGSLALSRALGDRETMGGALIYLGVLAEDRGDYEQAMALLEEGIEHAANGSDRAVVAQATSHQGIVATALGNLDGAVRFCEEGLTLARAADDPIGQFVALNWLANLARLRGDRGGAARGFAEIVAEMALNRTGSIRELGRAEDVSLLLPGIATLAVDAGRFAEAARLFGAADALRQEVGLTLFVPERDIFGRAADAARAALGADASAAWEAGRHLRPAEIDAVARAVFAAVEASAAPVLTPSPAAAPGSAPAAPAAIALDGLTRRETEVLRLLAEGLTNPQLAERLSISPSTVSSHLERIFSKLGVTTRAAAAAAAIRGGLLDSAP